MSDVIARGGLGIVVGAGAAGLSMVRALCAMKRPVALWDRKVTDRRALLERLAARGLPAIPVYVGVALPDCCDAHSTIYLSPGVDPRDIDVPEGQLANELALAAAIKKSFSYVLITGTNGKTTVSTWLQQLLTRMGHKAVVCGNIGYPLLDAMLDTDASEKTHMIVEMSSFQLQLGCQLDVEVGVMLNVSADHMERHGDMVSYHEAKQQVYARAEHWVFNRDDPLTTPMREGAFNFGLSMPNRNEVGLGSRQGKSVLMAGHETLGSLPDELATSPVHLANGMAVIAAGMALGLPTKRVFTKLMPLPQLPHRGGLVHRGEYCSWYDNSKATNPQAAILQLQSMPKTSDVRGVIVGGDGKGIDLTELCQELSRRADLVVAYGRSAGEFASAMREGVDVYEEFDRAVAELFDQIVKAGGGDLVLAPGCASTDSFTDYTARGRRFLELAQRLDS